MGVKEARDHLKKFGMEDMVLLRYPDPRFTEKTRGRISNSCDCAYKVTKMSLKLYLV